MKKVLSVLLAVCMLAALAVPAFAAWDGGVWGKEADIKKASFDQAEYNLDDILTDDYAINVAELLTCYDKNNNRICFDYDGKTRVDVRAFNVSNNEVLTLNGAGQVTKIMNNKPTDVKVTLSVTLASDVRASTVIVVPANADSSKGGDAYGYRLANAEVKDNATVVTKANEATLSYTFPDVKIATDFYVNGEKYAAAANAKGEAIAAGVLGVEDEIIINGVTYTGAQKVDDKKTVVWTADVKGLVPDEYAPEDWQLELVEARPHTDLAATYTAGTTSKEAEIVVTYGVPNGATKLHIGKGYFDVIGKSTLLQMESLMNNLFGDKGSQKDTVFEFYGVTGGAVKDEATEFKATAHDAAAHTVTFTAVAKTVETTAASAAITANAAYYVGTTSSVKFAAGNDEATGDALKYNIGDEITPILSSYSFTDAQKEGFKFAVRYADGNNSKYADVENDKLYMDNIANKYGVRFAVAKDDDGFPMLVVSVEEGKKAIFEKNIGTYLYVRVKNEEFANAQIEKEFRIKLTSSAAAPAGKKVLPVEKTIGVGQVLDLRSLHSSVKDVKTYWTVEPYGDYQTAAEAAIAAKILINGVNADTTYGWTVKGLAPSVVTIKLYDSYKDLQKGKAADSMKLNIGRGTADAPTISTSSATVKVGETVALKANTVTPDQVVKWAVSNENGTLDVLEGKNVKLTGKTEGTVVVTATVYESEGSTIVDKTLTTTVEVKAAEAPAEGTTATQNPQTGDSIFAHLFF